MPQRARSLRTLFPNPRIRLPALKNLLDAFLGQDLTGHEPPTRIRHWAFEGSHPQVPGPVRAPSAANFQVGEIGVIFINGGHAPQLGRFLELRSSVTSRQHDALN